MSSLEPVGEQEVSLTLTRGDDTLELSLCWRASRPRCFVATERYAISHAPQTPVDTPERVAAVHTLRSFIAAAEGGRGQDRPALRRISQ